MELSKESCEACRAGAPKISDDELRELMPKIPDWSVTVTWWSHKIRGLHRNDLIMAAHTDEVLPE